jgi:hypothetical protein
MLGISRERACEQTDPPFRSMGAQQAFQWAVSYPDFTDRIVDGPAHDRLCDVIPTSRFPDQNRRRPICDP